MAKPDQKRRDALYEQIEAADLAHAEARVKELKARKAHRAAEKAADGTRRKLEDLHQELRQLHEDEAADTAMPEGGA